MTKRRAIVVGACGVAAAITLIGVNIPPADLWQWNVGSAMLWPADRVSQVIPGGGLGLAARMLLNVAAWSFVLISLVAFPWKALGRALRPTPVPPRKLGYILGLPMVVLAAATAIYVLKASDVFLKGGGCLQVSIFWSLLMIPIMVGNIGFLAIAFASGSQRAWWAATAASTILAVYSLIVVYGVVERVVYGRGSSNPCRM